MRNILLGLILLVVANQTWAQMAGLSNSNVDDRSGIQNPAKVMRAAEGHWLAFKIPAREGARSPCCWTGNWNGVGEAGCSLEAKHQSYGTRSDSPLDENIIVFGRINQGRVQDLRVVGESCPVEAAGAEVIWIGDVDEKHGLDWLESAAKANDEQPALHAIALYRGDAAAQRLYLLAKSAGHKVSGNAIFWLGHSRGEQGFKLLKQLLNELPAGDTRQNINFALSQNDSEQAAKLLLQIARSDQDAQQRGDAMFWLAQEYPLIAQDGLLDLIAGEKNEDVLEKAVFAISQLPDGSGDQVLLELAKNAQQPKAVRRQALFWLANSDNDSSVSALTELLTN